MTHKLVKIVVNEEGDTVEKEDQVWCLVTEFSGSCRCFCDGQVIGYGESFSKYEEKEVQKGGVTCKSCIKNIKFIKSVKL
jgi:hypothetical protein